MPESYKLFVNEDRTVMVRIWDAWSALERTRPAVEVAVRDHQDGIWGPPIICELEK